MYDIHIASIGSEDLKVTIWKKDEKTEVSSNTEHVLCPWIPTDMATKASSSFENDSDDKVSSSSSLSSSLYIDKRMQSSSLCPSLRPTLHHTSIISAVFMYKVHEKTYIATSDIKDEIYIWDCNTFAPVYNLKGDILWIGIMHNISTDPIAMILSPVYNCEIWNLAMQSCLYTAVSTAFYRIDYCIGFPKHNIFAFSLYADQPDNNNFNGNDDDTLECASIQFWRYNIRNECLDFYYELKGKSSEKETVSAIVSCENLLITGHADKSIKIRKIDRLIELVESSSSSSSPSPSPSPSPSSSSSSSSPSPSPSPSSSSSSSSPKSSRSLNRSLNDVCNTNDIINDDDDVNDDDEDDNNGDSDDALTYKFIDLTQIADARYIARIGWSFLDTEDDINFKIVDIVQKLDADEDNGDSDHVYKKNKQKHAEENCLFYKYYSIDRYKRQPPINPCKYEYTLCDEMLKQGNDDSNSNKGKGWVQWKLPPGMSFSSSKDDQLVSCTLRGHNEPVYAFTTWVKNNYPKLLFSGSGDSTIRVWDLEVCLDERNTQNLQIGLGQYKPQCIKIFRGHDKYIYCLGVTSQANATGGCDTPILLSGGVDTKLHVWDCREVLYDLNWSRRCHFCMFLCVYNLLDRSDAVIRPKKLEKVQKEVLKRIGLGLRMKDQYVIAPLSPNVSSSSSSSSSFPSSCSYSSPNVSMGSKKYSTRGKRCRVYSHKEELIIKSAEKEREKFKQHVSERLQYRQAIQISLMEEKEREEKNITHNDSVANTEVTSRESSTSLSSSSLLIEAVNESKTHKRKIGTKLQRQTKKKEKRPSKAPALECVYKVFQSRHICSIIASFL